MAADSYELCRNASTASSGESAVRYLRAHAQELSLDPMNIGVFGVSAGGHLAALLGTTAGALRAAVSRARTKLEHA